MDPVSLGLGLTPRGRLVLSHDADLPRLDSGLAERLLRAFERGSGHGLLLLGADEAGTSLPPVHAYWREFGARFVTTLCVQEGEGAQGQDLRVASPPGPELERIALASPPMMGAEYLTPAVLRNLWQELDAAFGIELSESKCGVQDFLKRRNPAWNLVGRVYFNLAENRKDPDSPFAFSPHTPRASRRRRSRNISPWGRLCTSTRAPSTRTVSYPCWFPCNALRRHARG